MFYRAPERDPQSEQSNFSLAHRLRFRGFSSSNICRLRNPSGVNHDLETHFDRRNIGSEMHRVGKHSDPSSHPSTAPTSGAFRGDKNQPLISRFCRSFQGRVLTKRDRRFICPSLPRSEEVLSSVEPKQKPRFTSGERACARIIYSLLASIHSTSSQTFDRLQLVAVLRSIKQRVRVRPGHLSGEHISRLLFVTISESVDVNPPRTHPGYAADTSLMDDDEEYGQSSCFDCRKPRSGRFSTT